MKKFLFAAAFAGLLLSCKKESKQNNQPVGGSVDNFEEMVVSDQFDWSTNKKFTLDVEGLPGLPFEVQKILAVKTENDEIIYKELVKMGQSSSITFEAAARNSTFIIEYGSISKTVSVSGNSLSFSFIPEADNSDLDAGNL